MSRTEIEDRRQRALEVFADSIHPAVSFPDMLVPPDVAAQLAAAIDALGTAVVRSAEHAIEVATRVKITPEVIERLAHCWDGDFGTRGTIEAAIVQDVCAALGFEIVE